MARQQKKRELEGELDAPLEGELELELEPSEPKSEKQTFTRAQLEHCAQQAIGMGRHRAAGFSLLQFARSREPWRYGGRSVSPLIRREHGKAFQALVEGALAEQGGGAQEPGRSAAELAVAERIGALSALPQELLRKRIEELGREAPTEPLALVMAAYHLGVSIHGEA